MLYWDYPFLPVAGKAKVPVTGMPSVEAMSDYSPHKLDGLHWQRLRCLEAEDVVRRSNCTCDASSGRYEVDFLGEALRVDPREECFFSPQGEVLTLRMEGALAILTYLAGAQNIPLSGRFVSAKDLKGGELFFRGPHSFPVAPLLRAFGDDREGFLVAGRYCGGIPGVLGDASFQVMAFPRVPLKVLLWLADEDFPAEISFLFDATIERHLPLDVIFALVGELCFRMEVRRKHEAI